jgi:hypothetical protein
MKKEIKVIRKFVAAEDKDRFVLIPQVKEVMDKLFELMPPEEDWEEEEAWEEEPHSLQEVTLLLRKGEYGRVWVVLNAECCRIQNEKEDEEIEALLAKMD